ncbi:uncharacterized protein LOC116703625 [Etheostoma spectabile]|uniref:uncharacterized protein LOC116703625 n=1 Tax=Etheostoma spectabile TaxID=54343 RepID=UPI0013AF2F3B|nr:uncharacterized protein LOC116703625 [Etheostoma spectabile]
MFEIFMTNGKRKLLAAETAALRKEWVGLLWQAMNLSTSVVSDSRSTQHEVCEQRGRLNSSTPISSYSDCVTELMPARPLSAPAPTGHVHHKTKNIASPICLSEEPEGEEAVQQNTLPVCDSPQWSGGLSNAEGRQEGDYDILPLRTKVCENNASTETDEGVYDFPLSYRRAAEHPSKNPTESIYDVPSSLLRRMPDHTLEEQPEDEVYWSI